MKIVDFGIAKSSSKASDLTETGIIWERRGHVPEQALTIDHRSDIYMLGVMLYRAFTGKLPFVPTYQMGDAARHLVKPRCRAPSRRWTPANASFSGASKRPSTLSIHEGRGRAGGAPRDAELQRTTDTIMNAHGLVAADAHGNQAVPPRATAPVLPGSREPATKLETPQAQEDPDGSATALPRSAANNDPSAGPARYPYPPEARTRQQAGISARSSQSPDLAMQAPQSAVPRPPRIGRLYRIGPR